MKRKLQELMLAIWLERKFSKDEILALYLNRVYFGAGAYGVEAAAQSYFGKSARQVTVAEAAMLAGLVKSPSRLAPTRNFDAARATARRSCSPQWASTASSPPPTMKFALAASAGDRRASGDRLGAITSPTG